MSVLGCRTLQSGKEFSAFNLAVEWLDAQQITQIFDEADTTAPFYQTPTASPPSPPTLSTLTTPKSNQSTPCDQPATSSKTLTAAERKKPGSKRRKQEKREQGRVDSSDPMLKSAAKKNMLQTRSDTTALPHTKRSWIGKLQAQDGSESSNIDPPSPGALPAIGMVSHSYTQENVDRLSGTTGFLYVPWGGELTIPIVNSSCRNFALLGSKPKDLVGWQAVTDGATRLIGQMWPSKLQNHPVNMEITDKMLAHIFYQQIVGFTNCLVQVLASTLFGFCQSQMARLAAWDRALRWPFEHSIFAACTFNFGPRASTCPHLDFGNLTWGLCAITALDSFDADRGGHLILWDLKMVIQFPAGATILIPLAILRHSNVPVQCHETRCSFVQYTSGGLF
ncbi:hypothetical protein C8R45DRAFT_988945 [Mycena sanguinolenta]|nr:hypothetical protein C8R45DRAFT_988945 [Mycena sanguinolenta]